MQRQGNLFLTFVPGIDGQTGPIAQLLQWFGQSLLLIIDRTGLGNFL